MKGKTYYAVKDDLTFSDIKIIQKVQDFLIVLKKNCSRLKVKKFFGIKIHGWTNIFVLQEFNFVGISFCGRPPKTQNQRNSAKFPQNLVTLKYINY